MGWEEQLGITMDLLQTEWATYLQDLRERRFQIFGGLGWIADYADPENFLDVLFHSESSNNHTHYSDPELDALLERARVEQGQEARLALYAGCGADDSRRRSLGSPSGIPTGSITSSNPTSKGCRCRRW